MSKPIEGPTDESPEQLTDISVKKRKIKTKKIDSVTEEEVVPSEQIEGQTLVEESIEITEVKPDKVDVKPIKGPTDESPEQLTDISVKKRKIKTKKIDSVTEEEVVPSEQIEGQTLVEESIEITEVKPDKADVKPIEGPTNESPEQLTDISVKKRKIKTKKIDSVTEEEVVPSEQIEGQTLVEESIEITEVKPDKVDVKPIEGPTDESPEQLTDISVKKRKIKTKKKDSLTEEEVVPSEQIEGQTLVEESIEITEVKPDKADVKAY